MGGMKHFVGYSSNVKSSHKNDEYGSSNEAHNSILLSHYIKTVELRQLHEVGDGVYDGRDHSAVASCLVKNVESFIRK